MSKKTIKQMQDIVSGGENNLTNDDLLVLAREETELIKGDNFRLGLQSLVAYLKNQTIRSNAFFPININEQFLNSNNCSIPNTTIYLDETGSLIMSDYGTIDKRLAKDKVNRGYYTATGTIETARSVTGGVITGYFDTSFPVRSNNYGTNANNFIDNAGNSNLVTWEKLFDQSFEDYKTTEVTIHQGRLDDTNNSNYDFCIHKIFVFWGGKDNTQVGAFGQFPSSTYKNEGTAYTRGRTWVIPFQTVKDLTIINSINNTNDLKAQVYLELDTQNKKFTKLPLPYGPVYSPDSEQASLSVTIESF